MSLGNKGGCGFIGHSLTKSCWSLGIVFAVDAMWFGNYLPTQNLELVQADIGRWSNPASKA